MNDKITLGMTAREYFEGGYCKDPKALELYQQENDRLRDERWKLLLLVKDMESVLTPKQLKQLWSSSRETLLEQVDWEAP